MPFNLLRDPFFPVVTRSGRREWLRFAELSRVDDDYPVDFVWPRADFNIAAYEFAIGVATLLFQPLRQKDWQQRWDTVPTSAEIEAALKDYTHAFALDGDGPRFLQEYGGLDDDPNPIEALLIDTPGVNGQNKNTDVLTHRARYQAFGVEAAAMALYTLQQFAPSGGAGNRTSMRGGGPLTTLIIPASQDSHSPPLWRSIWANVTEHEDNEVAAKDLAKVLPWLAPTLTSDAAKGDRMVHPTDPDAHPLQAFFGMPRRMSLHVAGTGPCAMTGRQGPLVTGFVQKPWGMNYDMWIHPLTPYRQQKEGSPPYTTKPKSGRFGYRDWVAATVANPQGMLVTPAAPVRKRSERAASLRDDHRADARLRVGGWATNNMEAVTYLTAEQPLHLAPSPALQAVLDDAASRYAGAANDAQGFLRYALRSALFDASAKPDLESGVFDDARTAFYEATETAFHDRLADLLTHDTIEHTVLIDHAKQWRAVLAREAIRCFDRFAPIQVGRVEHAQRCAKAFGFLQTALAGGGKQGASFYQKLGIPQPAPVAKARKKGLKS